MEIMTTHQHPNYLLSKPLSQDMYHLLTKRLSKNFLPPRGPNIQKPAVFPWTFQVLADHFQVIISKMNGEYDVQLKILNWIKL